MKQQKLIKPPEYEIQCLDDFRKIPEDKIDKCLKEFGDALRVRKGMENMMNAIGETLSGIDKTVDLTIPRFTWIDDKEKKLTVHLKTPEKPLEKPPSKGGDECQQRLNGLKKAGIR